MVRNALGAGLLMWVAACGGTPSESASAGGEAVATAGGEAAPPFAGNVEAAPSMVALPGADQLQPRFTERMRFAWTLSEQAFGIQAPPQPAATNMDVLSRWAGTVLREWAERKVHSVEAARRELDAAAEESHRQRIVAGALVGLLYEDVARVLRAIPMPAELENDPEIAAIYRDVIDAWASPSLEFSRRAYNACAQNAVRPADMNYWQPFCRGRAERLPPARAQALTGSGQTTVEMIPDSTPAEGQEQAPPAAAAPETAPPAEP